MTTPEIWSFTEFPYACLKDVPRTTAFRAAIRAAVRPGDVVVDAGSGTGIMAFFAAEAGAARVHAVEITPVLAGFIQESVNRNKLNDRIDVILGDATEAPLPANVDVVVCELIDTGLMEEMQVAVLNALRERGVIGTRTRLVPRGYAAFVELVMLDDRFYGFRMAGPKHEWPCYQTEPTWFKTPVEALTSRSLVKETDFAAPISTVVERTVVVTGTRNGVANAVRLSGTIRLGPGLDLGATDTINGDRVLDLERPIPVVTGAEIPLTVSYTLGGGLVSFRCVAADDNR